MKQATRAMKFLSQKNIAFDAIQYEHEEKGAVFAAHATGFPLEKTIKTLVVNLGNKRYALALMPGDKQLDLKRIAQIFSVKKADMADSKDAERLTGYLVGGISPFGTKQHLPAVMDKSLIDFEEVVINAGQRGMMLKMSPKDIMKASDCDIAELAI